MANNKTNYKRAAVKYLKDREFYDCEYYVTQNGKEKEYKMSDIMADFISSYNDCSQGKFELTVKPDEPKILDPDGWLQYKPMSLDVPKGHKVTVTEKSMSCGYDYHKELAEKYLKVGEVYTVKSIAVYSSSSSVILEEIPDVTFNTVNFIDA